MRRDESEEEHSINPNDWNILALTMLSILTLARSGVEVPRSSDKLAIPSEISW